MATNNRRLAEHALKNYEGPDLESQTHMYGGESLGRQVESLSAEEEEKAHELLDLFGGHVERKFTQDPDSLSTAEVIILNMRNKRPGEVFSPHETAGLYHAMRYMQTSLSNPNSEISQERGFYSGDPGRENFRDNLLGTTESLNRSMFCKLTGLDEDRGRTGLWGRVKELDGRIREKSQEWYATGNKTLAGKGVRAMVSIFALKGAVGDSVISRNSKFETMSDEKFYTENQDLLLLEKDVRNNMDKSWSVVIDRMLAKGELSPAEAAQIKGAADKEQELRLTIKGKGAVDRRELILAQVASEGATIALEKFSLKDLDELAVEAAKGAIPQEVAELDDTIKQLDTDIANKKKELSAERTRGGGARPAQEKKIEDELKALEKKKRAAEATLSLAKPEKEKEVAKLKKKTVKDVAGMVPGMSEADILEAFEDEFGVKGAAAVDAELKKQDSISLFGLLLKALFGMSK